MLAKVLGFPIKPDVLGRLLEEQIQRTGGMSLQLCAALAEYFGLQTQLAEVPLNLVDRVTTPSLLLNGDELVALNYDYGKLISNRYKLLILIGQSSFIHQGAAISELGRNT